MFRFTVEFLIKFSLYYVIAFVKNMIEMLEL